MTISEWVNESFSKNLFKTLIYWGMEQSNEWVTKVFSHPIHSAVFFIGNMFVGKAINQQCCDIVTKH